MLDYIENQLKATREVKSAEKQWAMCFAKPLINVLSNLLGQQLLLQAINLPKHVQMEEVRSSLRFTAASKGNHANNVLSAACINWFPKWANCMQRRTKIFCQITTTTACRSRHIRSPGLAWNGPCCLLPARTRINARCGKGCILMSAFEGNFGTGILPLENIQIIKRFVKSNHTC